MDVYEHIAIEDRMALHAAIKSLLGDDGRVFISVPTPATQQYARDHDPSGLQPIDEDIGLAEVMDAAAATETKVLYYREVGIWRYCDYAHFVLERFRNLAPVGVRKLRPSTGLRNKIKGILCGRAEDRDALSDYIGCDLLTSVPKPLTRKFRVAAGRRKGLVSAWLNREE